METEEVIRITRRQSGRLAQLQTGTAHRLQVKTSFTYHVVEVEDLNFHHDSAVMLPDYGPFQTQEGITPEQQRLTGLAVIYACYRHVRENPEQTALVVGHTDRSGSEAYNQTLSELRADNVLAVLHGERTAWIAVCEEKSKVEDYQQILLWLTHSLGWDCDPERKDNRHGSKTSGALENFKRQYNERFSADLPVDGRMDAATWGAFFDVYMQELRYALGTDEDGLHEAQQSVRFTGCGAIGCGERYPITPARREFYRTPVDRRVEILFFDPGEEPVEDDCSQPRSTCEELYREGMYSVIPVPVDPLPIPSGLAVHVMLEFVYKDPENPDSATRAFPEGMPVMVVYGDGTSEERALRSGGTLEFFALREKESFTLQFETEQAHYIAAPGEEGGAGSPDEILTGEQVNERLGQGYRMFMLPTRTWGLEHSWSVDGAPNYDASAHAFTQLQDTTLSNIGSAALPARLTLDPHWQYLKFVYYDRLLKQKQTLPPVMLEGAAEEPLLEFGSPDTRSNWRVEGPHTCQCLPWIVQDTPMPGPESVVQFRTVDETYVESSSDGTLRLVEVRPEDEEDSDDLVNPFEDEEEEDDADEADVEAPPDVGLNRGEAVTFDIRAPHPDRLRYYDLPPVWKSRGYHGRLLSGPDSLEAARRDAYESLAGDPTSPQQPLMFSLDDIVLVQLDPDSALGDLEMLELEADDRVTVFCHTFAEDDAKNVGKYGVFDPDDDVYYLTSQPDVATPGYYIADYPDWTRLVIAQGALFDVFDRRTQDETQFEVVGARAATRLSSLTRRAPGSTASPRTVRRSFCVLTEFYQQRHDRWWTGPPVVTDDRGIGRFDMALLRCCDVVDGHEIAVNLQYHRFFFDFSNASLGDLHTDAGEQQEWANQAVAGVAERWNGPDGAYTPDPPVLLPQDPEQETPSEDPARPLRVHLMWFIQAMAEEAQAHFKINVKPDVRASMDSEQGKGKMKPGDNVPSADDDDEGRFTAAHETGHAGSLGDEYVERSKTASYLHPGFYSFSPGAPYFHDERGMMRGNYEVRTRYFWHVAEWLRSGDGDRGYFVEHDEHRYMLPHHVDAPRKTFVNFPLATLPNASLGTRGRFDWVLCPLGPDRFARGGLISGHTLDGVLVVVVKMKFTFHVNDFAELRRATANIERTLNSRLNRRWYVTGEFGASGASDHRNFSRCALVFSPRLLVTNFPDDEGDAEDYAKQVRVRRPQSLSQPYSQTQSAQAYSDKVTSIETDHGRHFEVVVRQTGSIASATWVAPRRLRITCTQAAWYRQVDDLLLREFPAMFGIDKSPSSIVPADLRPLVRIPGTQAPPAPILNNAEPNAF